MDVGDRGLDNCDVFPSDTWIFSIQGLECCSLTAYSLSAVLQILGSEPVEHAFQWGPRGFLRVRNAGDEEAFQVLWHR